tara:strand:+ start:244 stop:1449 length:1206 start_codon:yes stop_codon:yes gene_type:complete
MSPSKIQRCLGFYNHKIKDMRIENGAIIIEFHRTPKEKLRCSRCNGTEVRLYGKTDRVVRELSITHRVVFLHVPQNKIECPNCGVHAERMCFADRYARHTRRFERFVYCLCRMMTITDVAKALELSWDEVRHIDQKYLARKYRILPWKNVRMLGVDELAVARGHTYITVVVNLETGNVIYVGKNRTQATLERFFTQFGPVRCRRIKAIAMDMWKAYSAAVQAYLPKAKIVYDQFHLIAEYGKTLDAIRSTEYKNASEEDRQIIKGSRYLLLKTKDKLPDDQRLHLATILNINYNLNLAYILKDDFRQLWKCPNRKEARNHLNTWIKKARDSKIPKLIQFAKKLSRHTDGILNYFNVSITTALVEGINNKIKVLKRKMYGFRNIFYFALKIYDLHNLSPGFL